jgi:predicted AlkP superfamily phosphohydrolase/phosphomutase
VWAGALHGCLYVDPFAGVAASDRRTEIAERLIRELSEVHDPHTGAPPFALHDGRDLYGPAPRGFPPGVVLDGTESRWNLSMGLPPQVLPPRGYFAELADGRCGEHARDGIFVFSGAGIRVDPARGRAQLLDLAATVLHLYDVAIPGDYDSQPMTEMADAELLRQPVRVQPGDPADAPARASRAAVDSADLEQRLRRLGYIE